MCYFCVIATELLVLVLTWLRSIHQIRLARRLGVAHFPLAVCLVRNGEGLGYGRSVIHNTLFIGTIYFT